MLYIQIMTNAEQTELNAATTTVDTRTMTCGELVRELALMGAPDSVLEDTLAKGRAYAAARLDMAQYGVPQNRTSLGYDPFQGLTETTATRTAYAKEIAA